MWLQPGELQERSGRHKLALELPLIEDGEQLRLAQDAEGRCLLLSEDRLCALHRDHGFQSKPRVCREFPFFVTETPDGIQVGLSFRCSAVQQEVGQPWVDHRENLQELVRLGIPSVASQPVSVGAYILDWNTYKIWETAWRQALPEQGLIHPVACTLAQILPVEETTIVRVVQLLSASAIGFLESDTPDQATAVAQALRQREAYHSPRRGWVEAMADPFGGELDGQHRRYLAHVLERKSLWLGSHFLGRLLMLLAAENMLLYYQGLDGLWAAVDTVEGEWLAHRRGLAPLEQQFAQTLLQLC